MKPNIKSTTDIVPNFSHKFFLDSNVWFYLLFPQYSKVSRKVIDLYSRFYDSILSKGCLIETTILQISELVNLIQRIEYKEFSKKATTILTFKEFIKSENGKLSLKNAQLLVDSILKSASIRQGNLSESEMKEIMKQIEKADFNDMCIAKHCAKEQAVLVTHDFDFNAVQLNFTIVSANDNYLNA